MMVIAPQFSIIIPAYNSASKLADTLDSVVTQKGATLECVVVDGGSNDGTIELLKGYGDRISIVSEPDRGVYDAMNKGIELSTGKLLYFLGAGDVLRTNVLEQIGKVSIVGPTLVYGDAYLIAENRFVGGQFSPLRFTRKMNISHQAIFYSRDIFAKLGLYDLKYKIRADNVLNIKAFADRRISKTYVKLTFANFEGGGLSDAVVDEEFERDFPQLIRKSFGGHFYLLQRIMAARYALRRSS